MTDLENKEGFTKQRQELEQQYDEDLKMTAEAIASAETHAMGHMHNLREHDELWRECEALQKQIDELYKILLNNDD